MPPLPTSSRPTSNCGFTRNTPHAPGGERQRRRQDQLQRDEADVGDDRADRLADVGGGQIARVQPLARDHARIGGKPRVELAVADVDREHLARAALEKHLREAAGRRADVERDAAVRRIAEAVERRDQLQRAARDVVGRRIVEGDCRVGIDRLRWPGRERAVDGDVAAEDRIARPRPRRCEPALTSATSRRACSSRLGRSDHGEGVTMRGGAGRSA